MRGKCLEYLGISFCMSAISSHGIPLQATHPVGWDVQGPHPGSSTPQGSVGRKKWLCWSMSRRKQKKGRFGLRFINYHCIIMIHSSIIYHCVLYVFIYLYLFIVTVPWRQSWDFRTSTLSMDQHEHLISRIEWMSNGPNDNDCHWVILSGNST